jgi:hypothetical protein
LKTNGRIFLERKDIIYDMLIEITCYAGCVDCRLDGTWFYAYEPASEKEAIQTGKMGAVFGDLHLASP